MTTLTQLKQTDNFETMIQEIEACIGYEFRKKELLIQAFIRKSYAEENTWAKHNEVLEFIGDAWLGFLVTKKLIEAYRVPMSNQALQWFDSLCDEGELTKKKVELVQSCTLAKAVESLGLQRFLWMNSGDCLLNVQEQQSVKEDLFESILGAVAIDCDWDMGTVQSVLDRLLPFHPQALVREQPRWREAIGEPALEKSINQLQELNQKRLLEKAEYIEQEDETSTAQCHQWRCTCRLPEMNITATAVDTSKSEAKKHAAYQVLCALLNRDNQTQIEETCFTEENRLNKLSSIVKDGLEPCLEKAINQLQELYQKGLLEKAEYIEQEDETSTAQCHQWRCTCRLPEMNITATAVDTSKSEAKKHAAYQVLCALIAMTDN